MLNEGRMYFTLLCAFGTLIAKLRETVMIRTGDQYRDSIRDGREIHINGERVKDVTTHAAFKPLVDIRARESLTYDKSGKPKGGTLGKGISA